MVRLWIANPSFPGSNLGTVFLWGYGGMVDTTDLNILSQTKTVCVSFQIQEKNNNNNPEPRNLFLLIKFRCRDYTEATFFYLKNRVKR